MKQFDWPVRIYYEDTDAGGVVYHARYLAFYERARTEMLREFNINQRFLIESQKIAFVVKTMTIDYILPARLDDLLIVKSQIDNVRKASLTFKQKIVNYENQVINEADVLIACVDLNKNKPCVLPNLFISEFL